MQIQDARAVVTGAAGGLGHTFALRLLDAGARVAAGDTNAAGLRQLRADAGDGAERLFLATLDITDEASVAAFFAGATDRIGTPNVLLNCAGIARDGLLVQVVDGEVQRLPLAQWRKVVEVNLTGQFLMAREFAALAVAAHQPGVMVNVSSLARAGNPGQAHYAASKAGLDAATRTWALELAPHNIRVGAVAPGVTDTSFLAGFSAAALTRLAADIPLGRLGRAEEIWQAVRFILECEFFTGRVLEVDGGAAMGHAAAASPEPVAASSSDRS